MASHQIYNEKNRFLSKLKFKSKTLNILRNIVLSLVVILLLNWVIAITTDVNLLGTGLKKVFEALGGYTKEVPNITMQSTDWPEDGSWFIEKSAEWTGANTAEVTFDLDTKKKRINYGEITHPDVIIILDNSLSMVGEKLDKAKEHTINFIKDFIADEAESIALITFNDTATILTDFTRDEALLTSKVNSIEAEGNTNYNDALKKAGDILSHYSTDKERYGVAILFVTDGVPCIDTPNEVATARLLKEKYPFLKINGIQYEMGAEITPALEKISDYTSQAARDTLADVFRDLATEHLAYEYLQIVDTIENEYFYVKDESAIKPSIGTVKLSTNASGVQSVTWDLGTDFKTGNSASMTIELTLKPPYDTDVNQVFYPTNKDETVTSRLPTQSDKVNKNYATPVLQRLYNVTYLNNPPSGCSLSEEFTKEKHYLFENTSILESHPTCAGYTFRGWEVIDNDVEKLGSTKFIMPKHDVTLKATWGQQDISKSMEGTLGKKLSLYEIVQGDARSNNGAKIYIGDVTDVYNKSVPVSEKPGVSDGIYYYTSKTHNNVIFAGYCWQIVRTTTTGGVKLLYYGVPENGTCKDDRSPIDGIHYTAVAKTRFNDTGGSPGNAGYMYNTVYNYKTENIILDTALWGNGVEWKNNAYHLTNTITGGPDSSHHYTCATKSSTVATDTCTEVRYYYYDKINNNVEHNYYYFLLTDGVNIEQAMNQMLSDDDVNKTSSTIKTIIDDWYAANIEGKKDTNNHRYSEYLEDIVFCNDRTIESLGGFDPNNGSITASLTFSNYRLKNTYDCPRLIDQFSVGNSKAKLTYPVGLLTAPEANLMTKEFTETGAYYWTLSPGDYFYFYSSIRLINNTGALDFRSVMGNYDNLPGLVRPVVSLKPNTKYQTGAGTPEDPYIVDKPASS